MGVRWAHHLRGLLRIIRLLSGAHDAARCQMWRLHSLTLTGTRFARLLLRGRCGDFLLSIPLILEPPMPEHTLLVDHLVHVSCVRRLVQDLGARTRLASILVCCGRYLLPWSRNVVIVLQSELIGRVNHWQRCNRGWYVAGYHGMESMPLVVQRTVAVDDVLMPESGRSHVEGFRSRGVPCFRGSRSFLPCQILLGEYFLHGLRLPLIVSFPSPVINDSAAKLTEHGFCRNNGNLPGSVGIRQNILADQIVLLRLRGDNLVQGAVLVEEKVRISIT